MKSYHCRTKLVIQANPRSRRWFFGVGQPASLLDYLPQNTLITDEPDQCIGRQRRWLKHAEEGAVVRVGVRDQGLATAELARIHRSFDDLWRRRLSLRSCIIQELVEENMDLRRPSDASNTHTSLRKWKHCWRYRSFRYGLLPLNQSFCLFIAEQLSSSFIPNPRLWGQLTSCKSTCAFSST